MWSKVEFVLKDCWGLQSAWGHLHGLSPFSWGKNTGPALRRLERKGRSTCDSPDRKSPFQTPVLMDSGLKKEANDLKGSELHIRMRIMKMYHAYFCHILIPYLIPSKEFPAKRVIQESGLSKRRRDGSLYFFREKSKKIPHLAYLIPINSDSVWTIHRSTFQRIIAEHFKKF